MFTDSSMEHGVSATTYGVDFAETKIIEWWTLTKSRLKHQPLYCVDQNWSECACLIRNFPVGHSDPVCGYSCKGSEQYSYGGYWLWHRAPWPRDYDLSGTDGHAITCRLFAMRWSIRIAPFFFCIERVVNEQFSLGRVEKNQIAFCAVNRVTTAWCCKQTRDLITHSTKHADLLLVLRGRCGRWIKPTRCLWIKVK